LRRVASQALLLLPLPLFQHVGMMVVAILVVIGPVEVVPLLFVVMHAANIKEIFRRTHY
jgi:hypothetical protein